MNSPAASRTLIAAFVALIVAVPLLQCIAELRCGETPGAMRVFKDRPTRESLAGFEHSLEDASVTARTLRPWMQAGQFFALHDGGAKVQIGRNGWMFYTPGINTLTQRPQPGDRLIPVGRAYRGEGSVVGPVVIERVRDVGQPNL